MLLIINDSSDAYYNLAAEEYLIDHFNEDIVMLWRNDNTVVVGKNQNTIEEINKEYVEENGISVVVRKGSSTTNVNVWQSSNQTCKWYKSSSVTISCTTAFKRLALSCPESGYIALADDTFGDHTSLTDFSMEIINKVVYITFNTAVTETVLIMPRQLRVQSVECLRVAS